MRSSLHVNEELIQIDEKPNTTEYLGYGFGLGQRMLRLDLDIPGNIDQVYKERFSRFLREIFKETHFFHEFCIEEKTPLPELLAISTLLIKNRLSIPASPNFHIEVRTREENSFGIFIGYFRPRVSRMAYELSAQIFNKFLQDVSESLIVAFCEEKILSFINLLGSRSVNTYAIQSAVNEINFEMLEIGGGICCIGSGSRSKHINSTSTSDTAVTAANICHNKFITANILNRFGLPMPKQHLLKSIDALDTAVDKIGFPCVVKPLDQEQGRGVNAGVQDRSGLNAAVHEALKFGPTCLVEKYIDGSTHRFTVVNSKVVSVRRRLPGGIIGDGKRTVKELVAKRQKSVRDLRFFNEHGRYPVELDDEAKVALARSGMTESDIPATDVFQRLRVRDNVSAGGSNEEVALSDVHPDNLAIAIEATKAIRINIAGVDIISPEITVSWRENGAKICEVNAVPQFASRNKLDLYEDILRSLVGNDPHVPNELHILGNRSKVDLKEVVRSVRRNRESSLVIDGLAFVAQTNIKKRFNSTPSAYNFLVLDTSVTQIVCYVTIDEILKHGSLARNWNHLIIHKETISDSQQPLLRAALTLLKRHAPAPTFA